MSYEFLYKIIFDIKWTFQVPSAIIFGFMSTYQKWNLCKSHSLYILPFSLKFLEVFMYTRQNYKLQWKLVWLNYHLDVFHDPYKAKNVTFELLLVIIVQKL